MAQLPVFFRGAKNGSLTDLEWLKMEWDLSAGWEERTTKALPITELNMIESL